MELRGGDMTVRSRCREFRSEQDCPCEHASAFSGPVAFGSRTGIVRAGTGEEIEFPGGWMRNERPNPAKGSTVAARPQSGRAQP